jgi:hypothetical protein
LARSRKSAGKTGKKAKSAGPAPAKEVELRDLEAREREAVKGGGGFRVASLGGFAPKNES